jgi:hypothetical protein
MIAALAACWELSVAPSGSPVPTGSAPQMFSVLFWFTPRSAGPAIARATISALPPAVTLTFMPLLRRTRELAIAFIKEKNFPSVPENLLRDLERILRVGTLGVRGNTQSSVSDSLER